MRIGSCAAAWTLPALLAVFGCKEDTIAPEVPEPAAITIVSGSGQIQGRGRRLHEAVVVRAEGGNAAAMPGVMLTFEPGPNSGEVRPSSILTDALGQVAVEWTLGDVVGTQTLVVSSAGGNARVVVAATARPGDFDIQLVVDTGFTADQVAAIRAGVERWTAVIVGDLPDHVFPEGRVPFARCADYEELEIAAGGSVDDVRLGMGIERDNEWVFRSANCGRRRLESLLPLLVYIGIGESFLASLDASLEGFTAHAVGHLLGFGYDWGPRLSNRVRDLGEGVDTHFPDPATVAEFDGAGGAIWSGSKVPVENQGEAWLVDHHWRSSAMGDELMGPDYHFGGTADLPLSAVTVQSMATLGYEVDLSMADPYAVRVPDPVAIQVGPVTQLVAVEVFRHDGWIAEVVHKMTPYPEKPR